MLAAYTTFAVLLLSWSKNIAELIVINPVDSTRVVIELAITELVKRANVDRFAGIIFSKFCVEMRPIRFAVETNPTRF